KGVEWPGSVLVPAGKTLLAGDCRLLLAEAMGLPASLPDWRQIREKFKLELSDAPIPPGIYLALDDGRIETVFVEGDLQRLAFAARGGEQTIGFQQDGHNAELRYRPGNDVLFWSGPDAVSGCRFAEKLIVHGNIWAIEQSGNDAFAADSSIQVLASGQMRVNTGLSKENLDLQKARFANLLLMTSDRDFFSNAALNADIVLAAQAGSTIEAHLAAAGSVVHGEGLLDLSGSLIAGDIHNAGRLLVDARAGRFDFTARRVVRGFKCLQNFQFHFIVADSDEP
ncbi:MAG TPA: hypothetical protein VLQ89_06125, partial [Candidatus Binatia bacterium]|nr:hypothetical protein [Candidatus Binatia bacterium]